jgi:hypothetical protein
MSDNILYKDYFLTDNKSGWKCVPKKLERCNPELFQKIKNFLSTSNIPENIKFKQKIWHFLNNKKEIVKCVGCDNHSKFLDIRRGYQQFCSTKCSNKNSDKILKTKENNLSKWGYRTPFENPIIYDKYKKGLKSKYGVDNIGQLASVKDKIEKTNISKYGYKSPFSDKEHRLKWNSKTSKIEKLVVEKLGFIPKLILEGKEFDMYSGSTIIEVDGDYHHPKSLNNLSLIQLSSIINDKEKYDIVVGSGYKLIKINSSLLNGRDFDFDFIVQNSYQQDFSLGFNQVIVSKEYLTNYIDKNGVDSLNKYSYYFLKFIRTFQPTFPTIPTNEKLSEVVNKIRNYDYKQQNSPIIFNNNTSNVGVSYLKNIFDNYWYCSYKGNKSPIELWLDDDFIRKVINYRIGVNKNGEVWDFSLKNIIKGFSANRKTISFFKPVLAANIYKHYLGENENPIVFDPCAGFGGRLLGFKSVFPNGTYIGLDPDLNTWRNLTKLSNNFNDCYLYNTKLEDFNSDIKYDLAFTSIPYYDLETYSDPTTYQDFDDWVTKFIKPLLSFPNLLVNMSYSLCEKLGLTEYIDSYIESNTSHFNKKNNKKLEVIVKLNFK